NDFSGIISHRQGNFYISPTVPGGTALGTADVRLGTDLLTTHTPAYTYLTESVSGAGRLYLKGPMNIAQFTMTAGKTVEFDSVVSTNGGVLWLNRGGTGVMSFRNMPEGNLPPWFLDTGYHFCKVNPDGTVAPVAYTNGLANSIPGAYTEHVAASALPTGDAYARGLKFNTNINLDGRTLYLGDGVAGGLIINNANIGITGGVVDIGVADLHIANYGSRNLTADFTGTGRILCSVGNTPLYTGSLPDGGVVVQGTTLNLFLSQDVLLPGPVVGWGTVKHTSPYKFTIKSPPEKPSMVTTLNVGSGETIVDGGELHAQSFAVTGDNSAGNSRLTISNAIVRMPYYTANWPESCIGASGTNNVLQFIGQSDIYSEYSMYVGNTNAQRNAFIVDDSKAVYTGKLRSGNLFSADFNDFIFRNNANVTVGKLSVGQAGSDNSLRVRDSAFTLTAFASMNSPGNNTLNIGETTGSRNCVILESGASVTNAGAVVIGVHGNGNYLRMEEGSYMKNNNVVSIPYYYNTTTFGTGTDNELILAGGKLEGTTMQIKAGNKLVPEIQLDGFPEDGFAHFTSTVTFDPGAKLSPRAVKGARPGTHLVLKSAVNIVNGDAPGNLILDVPDREKDNWDFEITGGELRVTYKYSATMLIVR
ncbi:MAG: hypothetical protein FWG05_05815, partial [Kiritimatiellaeota bacterium]|nr:hypothetical protein [Kiritimatiellota bacterium]